MKKQWKLYLVGVIAPWILIGIAYFYFQQQMGLIPCPLCMFQRAALAAISVVCLIALFYPSGIKAHKVFSAFVALSAAIGAGIAGRQVWLQHLPADKVPECGFDPVYRWMETGDGSYSFWQMVATTLKGSGDCAAVDWSLLGLSMAGWMLLIFCLITLGALVSLLRSKPQY